MADPPRDSDPNGYTGTPRWVKVFGIVVVVLVLLFVVLKLTGIGGEHGPARHMSSGDTGGHTLPSSVTKPGGVAGHTPR
jgi:hypothetical protein